MHRIPSHTNGAWSFPIPWRSVCFSHSLLVPSLDAGFLWQTGHATLVARILLEKTIPTWEPFPTPRGPGVRFTGQVLRQLCAVPTVFRHSHGVDRPPSSELLKPTRATVKTQVAQPAEAPSASAEELPLVQLNLKSPPLRTHTLLPFKAVTGRPSALGPCLRPTAVRGDKAQCRRGPTAPITNSHLFTVCPQERTSLSIISCKLEILFTGKDTRKDSLQPLWKGPHQEP